MITIRQVKLLDGTIKDFIIESPVDDTVDAQGKLTLFPGLIDPHVHFRTPGAEHKEDWITGAKAAVAGGITRVIDMPNNTPSCISRDRVAEKKRLIDSQLKKGGIPLRYSLYLGADQNHLEEIGKCKEEVAAVKVFMGSSTGELLMNDPKALDRVFQIAAQEDMLVAVHAEDEEILQERAARFKGEESPAVHSKVRDREAALKAVSDAIELAEKYSGQLMILHVSTKEEIDLIRQAKQNGILVYAEATPHHLFLTEKDYAKWGTKVQMNPPLRTEEDRDALWEGIRDRTIDTIGSDHAPHTPEEKNRPYGQAPSGVPGVETTFPLLLNACHNGKITLERIVELMRINPETIYRLKPTEDVVLVDLELEKVVADEMIRSKCGWSPYSGMRLKGWPLYTILNGTVFEAGK